MAINEKLLSGAIADGGDGGGSSINPQDYFGTVLYTGAEALRICAVLLSPIMPQRIQILLSVLNTESVDRNWGGLKSGTRLGDHKPLFPRINSDNL